MRYDGLCLVGFGGPEHLDEVPDFLHTVARGRIPADRLAEVGQHYVALGGRSPLNEQHRHMLANLVDDLRERGIEVPVALGNRNSQPWLADALRALREQGCQRVLCVLTSLLPSYSGCRQYREDIAQAIAALGDDAPATAVLPPAPRLPGLRAAATRLLAEALTEHPGTHVVFSAHSIPTTMNAASGPAPHGAYAAELAALADDVAQAAGAASWELVWQSRSGSPRTPWLEPSILDSVASAADRGLTALIVHPIGFLTDHVEVIWDLDHEASALAAERGVALHRLPTVGFTPELRASLADHVAYALAAGPADGPFCREDCCHRAR